MAFTVELIDNQIENGKMRLFVKFSDGVNSFRDDFLIQNPDDFKKEIIQRVNSLEKQVEFNKNLMKGNIDLTSPVIEPPVPTPEEIKWKQYRTKLGELRNKKEFVELGILQTEDLIILQTEVRQLAKDLGEI